MGTNAAPDDQAPVIAFLSDPSSYPWRPARVERRETHGALVFLAGGEALKIKRAVRFPYMDFSTLAKRRSVIVREFEVNRDEAPEIYLGPVAITRAPDGRLAIGGEGEPVEWTLRMRRFADEDLLSARASRSPLTVELCRSLADRIAAYHERAPVAPAARSPEQMRAIVRDVTSELAASECREVRQQSAPFRDRAEHELTRIDEILGRRAAAGLVRRCHGDLHLGNIVLWDGKPVLFDAIEFDEVLATIDTLYDLAFLLMDLDYRGQRPAANVVLNRYLWRTGRALDLEGLAALPLFLALRAAVRAMVASERGAQATGATADTAWSDAIAYLHAASGHMRAEGPRLVAIGGLSGTGKSTLGASLAPALGKAPGALHVRSDLERKAMFGVEETTRLPREAYTLEAGEKVYARLIEKAETALRAGHSVVVDAVYATPAERSAVEALAVRIGVPFTGLWLEAPAATLIERVESRRGDASDATLEVVSEQLHYSLGEISWARVDSSGGKDATRAAAEIQLARNEPTV